MDSDIFDVAIIGSGPAGLTAGIYTSRANLKTLILGGQKWGGQLMLTTTVENFPGFPEGIQGPDLMEKMKAQAEKFGSKIIFEDVSKIEKSDTFYILHTNQKTFTSRSIIIASGADTVWLNLPNEQRLIGHGVSSCAPCDAFFFRGKTVAVIGGGDSACEEALFLTKFAKDVVIIHRRDEFRASKIMQDRVLNNSQIKVIWNTEVIDVLGQDHVEAITLRSNENGNEKIENLPIDGIFVAIGHKPNSMNFAGLVEIDEKGYITKSNSPGIFIAGDVADHTYKQAITAAAFGTMAAINVEKWLEDQEK